MDRREFIHALIRTGILSGFAIVLGIFISKDKISQAGEDDCNYSYQCRKCGRLSKCKLPEAGKFRRK